MIPHIDDPLERQILDFLSRPDYKPIKPGKLARRLKLSKQETRAYRQALERLITAEEVRQGHDDRLRAKSSAGSGQRGVLGILRRTSSGAGYVIPHDGPREGRQHDIFIAPEDTRDAHTGDEVLVRLLKRRRSGGQRCGRIEEVVMRSTRVFVGTYFEEAGRSLVRIDGNRISEPVLVDDPGAKGARVGDKVVIEMLRFPMQYQPGEAVLTKVLGPRGEPDVDTQTIIYELGLPDEFPEKALEEARQQADEFDPGQLGDRLDLTGKTIITIDPVDARDFDDAISLTRDDNGHWRLGVHIADVAHFVQPGSALDDEAQLRGNSVYLPQRVLPMLPEVLSNGLASLQKGKVRFTKSVFIEYSPEGIPVHTSFANSAIKVTRRFAYEEVMPILRDSEAHHASVPAKVRELLARMYELAMLLRSRRFRGGALELNLPEVDLDYDKDGKIVGAHETVHDESHQIIEEFMLAANMAVAQELSDREVAFLRRVHPDPSEFKMRGFAKFVTALGFTFDTPQSRPALQTLLAEVHGQPIERAVNYALLRSLSPAEYAGVDLGHYALAVSNYTHFTSPIRRYPDLTVHRLLDAVLTRGSKVRGQNDMELAKVGKHCSLTERRADAAERELIRIKLLTYMEGRVGEELEAVITGVEPFGLFCQGLEIPVEGLIHISSLSANDYFDYDKDSLSLTGRRGTKYRLGDRVRVTVAHVDVDRRELDFRIVEGTQRRSQAPRGGRGKGRPSDGSRARGDRSRTGGGRQPSRRKPKQPRQKRGRRR